MKITVMGHSGAGKSTLARTLGARYGIPVLHLDTVQFTTAWQERNRDVARAMVADFMERPQWVIDGNYSDFYQERRLEESDQILFLDFPRRTCLPQALGRYFKNRGKCRESVADGCIEKFDLEFLLWILRDGRTAERRARYRAICETYSTKTVVLKNRRQVERFLQSTTT